MPSGVEKMRDLGTPELEARERELAEQIFRLRFQLATGQAEAVTTLRAAKRDRARVKTLLREREISANPAAESRPEGMRKAK
jgi:large subunit ribosomal protein L29